jgi:D-lactate dehydrogenase (cytochrome)
VTPFCTALAQFAYLLLASIASGATFYYVGSRTSKSPVSTSKQGPGLPTSTSSTLPIAKVQAPEHDISPANMSAAYKEFVAVIGNENVSTAKDSLESHTSTEWSSYPAIPSQYPQYVLFPASTEEVSKIMKICHTRRIPVVAFSGGTSLEGHFANTRHGIALDFTRMNSIITVHKDDLDAVVQPGVRYDELNEVLEKDNLFFPPDPGPGAMIGGMIGTGCSGTNAYHYGTMREWVINVTAVMADGTIVKTRQRPRKSSAGYDLTKIFIGSEGTLGLITEATVKVTNKPQHENVAVVSFSTVRSAAECVSDFVKSGIQVAAVELLDETAMRLINEGGSLDRDWQETPTLFIKFNGTTAGVAEQIQIVQGVAKDHGSTGFVFAKDKEEAEDLWTCRKTALWGAAGIKKHVRSTSQPV